MGLFNITFDTMDKILRLISGQQFEIAENWGKSQISRILINQELGATEDFFKEEKEKSLQIDVFFEDNFAGIYDEMETVKKGSIGVITMSGVMTASGGWCNKGAEQIANEFRMLYRDKNIAGILFKVNSGGGESAAGDIIFNVISDRNKPVLTYTNFLGSAAVKGTLPSDEIMAASTSTEIGSIGTLISINKKYVEKAKEQDLDLYSELSPDKNQGWRELKNGNNQPLIDRATAIDGEFMKKVSKHRTLKGDKATRDKTLSGGLFIAKDAKKRGLIDSIGTMNYAFKRLNSHIKSSKK